MDGSVCVVPAGDWTGEGVIWKEDEKSLYWVDISRFLVHRLEVESGCTRSWQFDEPTTTLALTDHPDTLAVAVASRVIKWKPASDQRTDLSQSLVDWPNIRLNDGAAGPDGRFWVGSMRNNVGSDGGNLDVDFGTAGELMRVDGSGSHHVVQTGIGISNTICWSPRADRFYFADTVRNALWAFEFDESSGTIGNRRPFLEGFDRGLPDGSAVDRDGYLWNARYAGGCVVRIAPDGSVDRIIELPVSNITNCAFGGPELKTLYITSARVVNAKPERLEGSLFSIEVDTPGLPENRFRLT
jgi:sugar lactone lactonase YvrE